MNRILIIEDDEIMVKAVGAIFQKEGYETLIAKNGKEAFEIIGRGNFDIVVTDLMMPYANGFEIISRIRENINLNHVGIILMSVVGNEETILEAFSLGADDFLKKPIMTGELLVRIKRLLQTKRLQLSA